MQGLSNPSDPLRAEVSQKHAKGRSAFRQGIPVSPVHLRRREHDRRDDDHVGNRRRRPQGPDAIPPSRGQGEPRGPEEEGNVRPNRGGESTQRGVGKTEMQESVEPQERGRGIARPSAQTASGRNALRQLYGNETVESGRGQDGGCGAMHQIRWARRDGDPTASQPDVGLRQARIETPGRSTPAQHLVSLCRTSVTHRNGLGVSGVPRGSRIGRGAHNDRVGPIDRLHHGPDLVISVLATTQHLEDEVQLGGSAQLQLARHGTAHHGAPGTTREDPGEFPGAPRPVARGEPTAKRAWVETIGSGGGRGQTGESRRTAASGWIVESRPFARGRSRWGTRVTRGPDPRAA